MMELRLPTLEQLRTVYDADLLKAFPAAELKPLRNMEELWEVDRYRPWCLFDGLRTAGYDTEMFGVHYKTLYLFREEVDDAALMEEHRFVYQSTFSPEKYTQFVRIPYDPGVPSGPKVAWEQ